MEISEILKIHLNNIKDKIAAQMEHNKRNASGRSVASLIVEIDGDRGAILGDNSFLAMERGRGPGKIPYNFVGIIKDWITSKGISAKNTKRPNGTQMTQETALNSFAGAVAFSIMKNGTKLHRDKGFDDIYSSAISEELELMAEDMAIKVIENINEINKQL